MAHFHTVDIHTGNVVGTYQTWALAQFATEESYDPIGAEPCHRIERNDDGTCIVQRFDYITGYWYPDIVEQTKEDEIFNLMTEPSSIL